MSIVSGKAYRVVIEGTVPPGVEDQAWKNLLAGCISVSVSVLSTARHMDITIVPDGEQPRPSVKLL